jgi:hypothetical protein
MVGSEGNLQNERGLQKSKAMAKGSLVVNLWLANIRIVGSLYSESANILIKF